MGEQEHNIDLKPITTPQEVENIGHGGEERPHSGEEALNPQVSFKLVMSALAVVTGYFGSNFHLIGSGVLAHTITSVVGGEDKVAWITGILTFHPVVLGPPICKAADLWGRKWFMVITLFLGFAGCIITSRASNIGQVLAGQVIAGFAGINQALPQAVTSEVLPRKYRSWAQVMINAPGAAAALIGIYLTGAMTRSSAGGFRNYWYLCAAIYLVAGCIIAYFYRPPVRELQLITLREKLHRLDLPGCLLLAVTLLGITLALNWSNNPYGWQNTHVLVPFIVGVCGAASLIFYVVRYRKDGIFHHGLFRSRNFIISEICLIGEGVVFICANNYLGFQLSIMYGSGSWEVAMFYTVAFYSWLVAAPCFGWFIARTQRARLVVILSLASFTLYFALMASTNLSTKANIWGYNVFLGLGLSGGILSLITLAQLSIPAELIAPATGLIVATRTFGAAIGLVIFNAILNSALSSRLVPEISQAAVSAGLPDSSLEALISALTGGNPSALQSVPHITNEIIQASTSALKHVYNVGFRNGYASAAAFSAVSMIAAFFAKDVKQEYTAQVDAPLLTDRKIEVKA